MIAATAVPYRAPKGFEGLHHHWDGGARSWIVQILPGEFYVTPNDEIISTVLGSCVSTCMRVPRLGVGGMNHFMLPDDPGHDQRGSALRYGCFAVERLINELLKHGAAREELEVKIFGGGQVIASMSDIGRSNIEFVRGYLRDERIPIVAEDVGGTCARRLRYYPRSGRVLVKQLPMRDRAAVGARERKFRTRLLSQPVGGDVELF
jgi:chemotaxis protein CheD